MKTIDKKLALTVLNSLEVIEREGGEYAYILVENNEENRLALNAVDISDKTIKKYGDDKTFCILALAFGEKLADLYAGGELIYFDKMMEFETETPGVDVIFYECDGETYIAITEPDGSFIKNKVSSDKLETFQELFCNKK